MNTQNSIGSISVVGIGWLTTEAYGCIRTGRRRTFEPGEGAHALTKKGIFAHPFKNYGRLDTLSRMTAYAVSLALQDANIEYAPGRKQDIGIIGTSSQGSLQTDREFFEDYVSSGRTLSRGSLFIYTLPSSSLGESAIHFGLRGPLLYLRGAGGGLAAVLDGAADMIATGEAPLMLAGQAEPHDAFYCVLAQDADRDHEALCDLASGRRIAAANTDIPSLIHDFSLLAPGKA
ncbi:MAG TPA: beta-ketoacyl synthase N-terminal-like domain-containing protein [Nitrospirota bacterium]|nr:beta-ketoacyl synthase N-terminal-like domain-containing protein [Nitrospirota bacterium]